MKFHSLIASDIDGTLIPEESTVMPEAVFEQVRAACEKGYLFVAASGRQYPSLRSIFAPVADKMAFLIENGGGLYFRDELLYANAFERELAIAIAKYVQATPNCEFLADGAGDSFVIPKTEAFLHQLLEVQKLQIRCIPDFDHFPDQVMKIAVWCTDGSERHERDFCGAWGGKAKIAISGKSWIDFNISDKGSGLKAACELFGIPQERTIAFGDNWNDVPMLDFVHRPYIMKTARPQLLAQYAQVCEDVPSELKKILAEHEKKACIFPAAVLS